MRNQQVLSLDPFIIEVLPLIALDGCRVFATDRAKSLLPFALGFVEEVEEQRGGRTRARKPDAQEKLGRALEAILAEVCYQHLVHDNEPVYLPMGAASVSGKSRYKPSFFGKTYLQALELASDPLAGLLILEKGYQNPFNGPDIMSSVTPGKRLVETIKFLNLTADDFGYDWRLAETIILRDKPTGRSTWRKPGKEVEYDDTPETLRYRAELAEINDWLFDADISCADTSEVDTQRRTLRRIFNNRSFENGGRLYGAYWVQMGKADRARLLRLQGEATASLDFAQFNPRAAYGTLGLEPDFVDAYNVPSWPKTAARRSNAKIVMNQLLSAERIPQGPPEEGWDNSDSITYKQLRDDLIEFHAPIRDVLGTGLGHRLSFLESQVMVACLLDLKAKGIVGLPVHDCLIVPASAASYGTQLMQAKAKEITGVVIPVKPE
jgi:hypothetical protein